MGYMHVTGGGSITVRYNTVVENPSGRLANKNSGILVMFEPDPNKSNIPK